MKKSELREIIREELLKENLRSIADEIVNKLNNYLNIRYDHPRWGKNTLLPVFNVEQSNKQWTRFDYAKYFEPKVMIVADPKDLKYWQQQKYLDIKTTLTKTGNFIRSLGEKVKVSGPHSSDISAAIKYKNIYILLSHGNNGFGLVTPEKMKGVMGVVKEGWKEWYESGENIPVGTSVKINYGQYKGKLGKVSDESPTDNFSIVKVAGKKESYHNSDLLVKESLNEETDEERLFYLINQAVDKGYLYIVKKGKKYITKDRKMLITKVSKSGPFIWTIQKHGEISSIGTNNDTYNELYNYFGNKIKESKNNDTEYWKKVYPNLAKKVSDDTIKKLQKDTEKYGLFATYLTDMDKFVSQNKKIVPFQVWLKKLYNK